MAAFTKAPGTWRLWSEKAKCSAQWSLPRTGDAQNILFPTWKAHGRHCLLLVLRQHTLHLFKDDCISNTSLCRKRDLKQLFSGQSRLTEGLNTACWLGAAADVWLHGPFHQQRCGTEHLGAGGRVHPSILSHCSCSSRVPGHGWRWSWPFGFAKAAQEVKSTSSVSNVSAKEICLQEIQTFEAFQVVLSEGVIYFF